MNLIRTNRFFLSIKFLWQSPEGYSLIEFLIVIAIFIFLSGFITLNLVHTQQHTSLSGTIDQLAADSKQQQLKSMINDTEGRGTTDTYGIYFQSTKYTLFHGASYSFSDPANFVVNLDTSLQFSAITVPDNSIIFAKGSGEVVGFSNGENTISLKDTTSGDTKTITFNQYGIITNVQ